MPCRSEVEPAASGGSFKWTIGLVTYAVTWGSIGEVQLRVSVLQNRLPARLNQQSPETALHFYRRYVTHVIYPDCSRFDDLQVIDTAGRFPDYLVHYDICTAYTRTLQSSASVLTSACLTSSVIVWRTSGTICLPRDISLPRRILSYPGLVPVGNPLKRVLGSRTWSMLAGVFASRSLCAS